MRCEVVAIGTELLLGQIVDTNSAWIGGQLALAGIDSHFQTKVGDNLGRIVACIRQALERSDAVILCGGLGPTQDDITREAIAEVMGVPLVRSAEVAERIRALFAARGREMAANNLRQADVPEGASVIPEMPGTAPGLICPLRDKVIYAVPGVPHEMRTMMLGTVLPDLQRRAGLAAVIKSRVLRTWGHTESGLAELLAARILELDLLGNPTLAFQASGIEGIKVRITAKAGDLATVEAMLAAEEARLRPILGNTVFGVDDQTMESVVLDLLRQRGLTLALAESVSGGLAAARLSAVPGPRDVFRGALVAYASEVKFALLSVPEGPVVCEAAAQAMAAGVRKLLGADVGLATTGVAGPEAQDGHPMGTVFLGLALGDRVEAKEVRLPGDPDRIRQYSVISVLDLLRRRLLEDPLAGAWTDVYGPAEKSARTVAPQWAEFAVASEETRMFIQTRRNLSKKKALQPIYRMLRPAYYKYVKKRPWINYDRLEVIQRSPYQNIYYCCTQRTGSQWFKKILRDPAFYQYTGLKVYHYGELGLKQAKFDGPLPEGTVGTHLYIGYPTYLSIPKPARYRTFFILRDPRDISVSWYFAARYSHGALDPIPRLRKDLKNLSLQDGLKYSIDSLEEFGLFWAQSTWMEADEDRDRVKIFRYEDFSKDNRGFLEDLLNYMGVAMPEEEFAALYERHAFRQITGGREAGVEDQHDHYRKGVSGDWRNYFDPSLQAYFRKVTGDLLDVLGYAD